MFKINTKTKIGFYISGVNSILVILGCVLFFIGYYYVGINQLRDGLLLEAQEIVEDHLSIDGNRIIYQQDKDGLGLEQDLLRDQASVVMYNKELQEIGSFGIYELKESILSNNNEEEYQTRLENVMRTRELIYYSEFDLDQERNYEVLIYPILRNKEIYGLVQVAMPTKNFDNLVDISFSLFLILIPLSILVNFFLGQLIARQAYLPINLLVKKMKKISVTNLGETIDLKGDSDDEIYQLSETFNSMMGRINEGVDKQKQFIANASHELKSPITRVLTGLEVVESMRKKNLPIDEKVKAIKVELLRMGELIDKLLILSKIKEQDVPFEVINISKALAVILKRKGYLNFRIESNDKIKFPISYFNIISENLIENAHKYSPLDSTIVISSEEKKETCVISFENKINDSQTVMNESFFERFKRGRNIESKEGYGLGLSIVKTICEEYEIQVRILKSSGKVKITLSGFRAEK